MPIDDAAPSTGGLANKQPHTELGPGLRFMQPQTLLSFLFALLIVVFLVRRLDIDPGEVWRRVREANPVLVVLGLLVFYASFVVRALRMAWMLNRAKVQDQPEARIPAPPELVEIVVLGWFTNCVAPARLGDVYRAWLLKRRANVPFTLSMGVIGAERLIDLAALLTLLGCSGLIVFGRHFPHGTGGVVLSGGAVLLLAAIVIWTAWVFRDRLMGLLPDRLSAPVDRIQQGFFENLRAPWRSLAYSFLMWSMDGLRFFLVAWSLGVVLPPSTALFLVLIGAIASASPVTPAGLGVVEAVLIAVLPLVGVHGDTATAIVVVERAISYWSLIVVGLALYAIAMRRDVAVARREPSST